MLKSMLTATILTAVTFPSVAALASPSTGCLLDDVTTVQAITTERHIGKIAQERTAGATLFVPAQAGWTTDWIKRQAEEHRAQMAAGQGMKADDCVLGVADSRIEVSSNGSGFLMISVRSDNEDSAKEILRRAERLVK